MNAVHKTPPHFPHQAKPAKIFQMKMAEEIKQNAIHCGDCATILKDFPDNSIDAVITSPPYFQQREYTGIGIGMERNVAHYLDSLHESFAELTRVIKQTGSILYNIGDKIDKQKGAMLVPYRFAISALEKHSDLILLNNIVWAKKNPTPRQFGRRLVSSTEPFFHFVKSKGYYYALNDFMPAPQPVQKNKPTSKLGARYFSLLESSDLSSAEKERAKHAIREAIAEVRNEKIIGFRVKIRGIHAPAFGGQDGGRKIQMEKKGFTIIRILGNPMKKDYIEFPVENVKGVEHPAIFPLQLIEEFIGLVCPPDGVVLDPYCGSGTTLLAAKNKGRSFIGIDINPKYCNFSKDRVNEHQASKSVFG